MSLERFMKVYSYLPLEERKLTIVVIGGQPINWKRAYEEIKKETKLGEQIQKKLIKLNLI
jgi:hypothetical protein